MIVLVDTPVWSLVLRQKLRHHSPEQMVAWSAMQELVQHGRARIIGPVRQELLSGFREESEFQKLRDRLKDFDDASVDREDYEKAAHVHNLCRAAGVSGSAVDFLLCAVALRRDWQIFTLDKDFERYARRVPISLYAR